MSTIKEKHIAITFARLLEMVQDGEPFAIYGHNLWSNDKLTDTDQYRYENALFLFDGTDIYVCSPAIRAPSIRSILQMPDYVEPEDEGPIVRRVTDQAKLVHDFNKLPTSASVLRIDAPGIGEWRFRNPKPSLAMRWTKNVVGSILKHHLHELRRSNTRIVIETDAFTRCYIDPPDLIPDAFDVVVEGNRSQLGGQFDLHDVHHEIESELSYILRTVLPTAARQVRSILSEALILRMGLSYLIEAYTELSELPKTEVRWIPRSRIVDWPESVGNAAIEVLATLACAVRQGIRIPKKRLRLIVPESIAPVNVRRPSRSKWTDIFDREFAGFDMPVKRHRFSRTGTELLKEIRVADRVFHDVMVITIRSRKGSPVFGYGRFATFKILVADGQIYATDISQKKLIGPVPLANRLPIRKQGTFSYITPVPGQVHGFPMTVPDKDLPTVTVHWKNLDQFKRAIHLYYTLCREGRVISVYSSKRYHLYGLLYSAMPTNLTVRELATFLYFWSKGDYESILHRMVPGWTVYYSQALQTTNLEVSLDVVANSIEWASSVALAVENVL